MERESLTDNRLQARFLPIVQRAEAEIKRLIAEAALTMAPKGPLRARIKAIVDKARAEMPDEVPEKESYADGLAISAERWIRDQYRAMAARLLLMTAILIRSGWDKAPSTPMGMYALMATRKIDPRTGTVKGDPPKGYAISGAKRITGPLGRMEPITPETRRKALNLWDKAKGSPNVYDYPKAVKRELEKLAKDPAKTKPKNGKRPLTPWQQAELGLRHDAQMKMIQDLKDQGVRYAWASTHPDCSKRCEKWQGKLFDLTSDRSELSGHRMSKKVGGNTVYCFKEIAAIKDKYGYENNIIVGFNCRHRLVPYEPGSTAPEEYTAEEVRKYREINERMRGMERRIRQIKEQAKNTAIVDPKLAKALEARAKAMAKEYMAYANRNGFAYFPYRIKI